VARGDDIEERLIEFAVRIIRVCDALSDKPAERHIRGQLLRCGPSAAPNYAEARGAESGKDYTSRR
jgi:four helix bundle protein